VTSTVGGPRPTASTHVGYGLVCPSEAHSSTEAHSARVFQSWLALPSRGITLTVATTGTSKLF
jgi:hypothetical protein